MMLEGLGGHTLVIEALRAATSLKLIQVAVKACFLQQIGAQLLLLRLFVFVPLVVQSFLPASILL